METEIPDRFYKVASPYRRAEDSDGNYVVDPDGSFLGVADGYEWVFDRADEVEAIEKIDGGNMSVRVSEHEHGGYYIDDVATRMGDRSMNRVEPFGPITNHHYIARAVQNTIQRGYVEQLTDEYGTGWYYGEAVGPKFQGNPHQLAEHLFIPFDWLRDKCEYNSYGEYPTDFESIQDWFRGEDNGLFSLFANRMHEKDLAASRPENGTFCEGIIFLHPDFEGRIGPDWMNTEQTGHYEKATQIAKIRRDMFSGFQNDEWPMTGWGH